MSGVIKNAVIAAFAIAAGAALTATDAMAQKPNIMKPCLTCHQAVESVVRGKQAGLNEKFKSVYVDVGPLVWIIKYDDNLKVKQGDKISGPDALKAIAKNHEIAVTYTGTEMNPVASRIAVKQPYKLAEDKLVNLDEMKSIIAQGPDKSGVVVFDTRPLPAFAEGHLRGAMPLPYGPDFKDKAASALPKDKSAKIVFYCAGYT